MSRQVGSIILIVLSLQINSCSSWRFIEKNEFKELEQRPRIKVRLVNGELIETNNYNVRSDTLVIFMPKTPFYRASDKLIHIDEIKEIEIDASGHVMYAHIS